MTQDIYEALLHYILNNKEMGIAYNLYAGLVI